MSFPLKLGFHILSILRLLRFANRIKLLPCAGFWASRAAPFVEVVLLESKFCGGIYPTTVQLVALIYTCMKD